MSYRKVCHIGHHRNALPKGSWHEWQRRALWQVCTEDHMSGTGTDSPVQPVAAAAAVLMIQACINLACCTC